MKSTGAGIHLYAADDYGKLPSINCINPDSTWIEQRCARFALLSPAFHTGGSPGNFLLFEDTDLFRNSAAGASSYGIFSVDVGQHGRGEFAFINPGTPTATASANSGSLIVLAAAAWRFRRKA